LKERRSSQPRLKGEKNWAPWVQVKPRRKKMLMWRKIVDRKMKGDKNMVANDCWPSSWDPLGRKGRLYLPR